MKEGDAPSKFYFIINGTVDVISIFEDFEYFNQDAAEQFMDPEGVNKKKNPWWRVLLNAILRWDELKPGKKKKNASSPYKLKKIPTVEKE